MQKSHYPKWSGNETKTGIRVPYLLLTVGRFSELSKAFLLKEVLRVMPGWYSAWTLSCEGEAGGGEEGMRPLVFDRRRLPMPSTRPAIGEKQVI